MNYVDIRSNNGDGYRNSGFNYNGTMNVVYKPADNLTFLAGGGGNSGFTGYQ